MSEIMWFLFLIQIFLRNQHLYTVEQNDAEELVARAARNIEQLLRKRSAALEVKLTPLRETNCRFAIFCWSQSPDALFINKGCDREMLSIIILVGEYLYSVTKVHVLHVHVSNCVVTNWVLELVGWAERRYLNVTFHLKRCLLFLAVSLHIEYIICLLGIHLQPFRGNLESLAQNDHVATAHR